MEIKVRAGRGEYFKKVEDVCVELDGESISLLDMAKELHTLKEDNKKLIKYLKEKEESELHLKLLVNKSIELLSTKVARLEKKTGGK